MKNLKVCFIGCGDHARRFILPALAGAEQVTLSAICARTREHAEAAAARTGARRACTDYREMIETEQPDAVFVVGPPKLQFDAGMFCLAHKIPFFSEKPCGSSLKEAEQLVAAAAENGCFGQVGFMMRHSAVMREVRKIMVEEPVGRLEYGTVKYFTSGPYRSDEIYGMPGTDDLSWLWRYLMVQAVHPVNLASSFLGEIREVAPEVRFAGENILVELRLTDLQGRRFQVLLHTFVAPGYGNLKFETELFYANRGMIFTDAFHALEYYPPEPLRAYQNSGNGNSLHWQFATFGNNNVKMGYETEVRYFLDCVRNGVQPDSLTTLPDWLKTMKILDSAFQTVKKGNPIS